MKDLFIVYTETRIRKMYLYTETFIRKTDV